MGHHGNYGSNTDDYITALNPEVAVLIGNFQGIKDAALHGEKYTSLDTVLRMADRGTPLYCTAFYSKDVPALVFQLDNALNHQGIPKGKEIVATSRSAAVNYKDGFPKATNGWKYAYTGGWYYFNESSQPVKNQFIWYYDCWYYLSQNGKAAIGWKLVDGYWYYMNSSGAMITEWQYINHNWYYLNDNGVMATGWKQVGGKCYYFNGDGIMQTGWQYVDSKWYYLHSDGSMATCWLSNSWKWYYMNESGQMQANKWISGIYYVKGNGEMATSEWVDGYYVDNNGVWVR